MKLATVLIALCSFLVSVSQEGCRERKAETLTLCELVANWQKYHGQHIRVHASYKEGGQTWLYDPACQGGKGLTHVSFRDDVKGLKQLERAVAKDPLGRATVQLEGVFFGPEPFKDIDPNLPASVREALEKSHRRYGHMDAFDTMIEVTRVVRAAEIAARPNGR